MTNRLNSIEFLRVYLILVLMFAHCKFIPQFNEYLELFHAQSIDAFIEYFFIIGGFFLYKRINSSMTSTEIIKKCYLRCVPGLFFAFIISLILQSASFKYLPKVIFMTIGTGLEQGGDLGVGSWFLCVYFWVTCLLVGLFKSSSKKAFVSLGIVIYILLVMRAHVKPEGHHMFAAWYGVMSCWTAKGICGMGLGLFSCFLAEHIRLPRKKYVRIIFTIVEAYCLYCIWNRNFINTSSSYAFPYPYSDALFMFVIFMISSYNSWGYISCALNKISCINYISRYTFSFLIGHIIIVPFLVKNQSFGLDSKSILAVVYSGGIAIGIIEYHLIERWLVPKIKNALSQKK